MPKKVVAMEVVPSGKPRHRITRRYSVHRAMPETSPHQESQLGTLIGAIADSWRLIGFVTLLLLLIGIAYILLVSPVYRADVLLQVEENPDRINTLMNPTQPRDAKLPLSAENEIIKSRMVLGTAVDRLNLTVVTRPLYFPVFGAAVARLHDSAQFSEAWFDLEKYAWGGEHIKMVNFDVPKEYFGMEFTMVAGEKGRYLLLTQGGALLLKGEVGKPAEVTLANGKKMNISVSELSARPGTHFQVIKKDPLQTIQDLKDTLKISESGKQASDPRNQAGILKFSLEGDDRKTITATLNEIANIYLRLSVESKSNEAEKTLAFLEKQLPALKEKVELAEAELNKYRLQSGSVDLPLETQTTLERVTDIDTKISDLKQQREELLHRFTPQHPRVAALDSQLNSLNAELRRVESRVHTLPGTQQDILRLTRDADVSRSLYTTLLNSAQELRVVKAGVIGNVRIVDYAMEPSRPVKPDKGLVIVVTVVTGMLLGAGLALLRKSLFKAVQDPDLIEQKLGIPVYATIPYSRKQRELGKSEGQWGGGPAVLAVADPGDLAIESLRGLRTSLYYERLAGGNNIISVTSPSPGAGKSFVCVNLAVVLAVAGKRVLVIDADLRKGRVHEYFGLAFDTGLSDLITHSPANDFEFNKVILKTLVKNLDFIPVGTIPPNPSELLLHKKFSLILEVVADDYDHIIIDTPPILAATDAAIVGNLTGTTLLVVKDGQNTMHEIEQSVRQLKQAGVQLAGAIYNGIKLVGGRYGYGRYYYAYSYNNK